MLNAAPFYLPGEYVRLEVNVGTHERLRDKTNPKGLGAEDLKEHLLLVQQLAIDFDECLHTKLQLHMKSRRLAEEGSSDKAS